MHEEEPKSKAHGFEAYEQRKEEMMVGRARVKNLAPTGAP
jgi:hypothetical protein